MSAAVSACVSMTKLWCYCKSVHCCSGLKEAAWMHLGSNATVRMQTLQMHKDCWVNAAQMWWCVYCMWCKNVLSEFWGSGWCLCIKALVYQGSWHFCKFCSLKNIRLQLISSVTSKVIMWCQTGFKHLEMNQQDTVRNRKPRLMLCPIWGLFIYHQKQPFLGSCLIAYLWVTDGSD